MQGFISQFLNHLSYERRLSNHTVSAYQNDLAHFHLWLRTALLSEEILFRIDYHHIREYLAFCHSRYSQVSIARRLSAIRAFFRYLVRSNIITTSPADYIESPNIKKPLPKPVTVEDAFSLCDMAIDNNINQRDKVIAEILYGSGIRISELVNLDVDNVDLTSRLIRVMGKGKKERIVPIHHHGTLLIGIYIKNIRPTLLQDPLEKALFLGKRGERINPRVVRRF